MKNCFVLFLLLFCVEGFSQKIDGFYKGVLNNDSANKMVQEYELAIAMYKGKITGYSYVTFIVKDTFYYGIRKVKGEIVGDSIVVTDDKFVSDNFPENPAKGVKRTITIPLNGQDSITVLSGKWKTNQTKRYYSVPGTIELAKSADSTNSPLINHLKELGIVSTENYMVTAAETKSNKTEETKQPVVASNEAVATTTKKKDKKNKDKSKQDETVKENTLAGNDIAKNQDPKSNPSTLLTNTTTNQQTGSPVAKTKEQTETAKQDVSAIQQAGSVKTEVKEKIIPASNTSNTQTKVTQTKVTQTVDRQPDVAATSSKTKEQTETEKIIPASNTGDPQTSVAQSTDRQSNATKTSSIQTAEKSGIPKTIVMPEKPSFQKRSTVVTRTVEVSSDSIVLAFYDNGVVDGDSISVYMNGELIVPSTKLRTVATKATISVAGQNEVKLVLVADNLGSIPPNTGLMSIRDGDNIYQVHFSADMQTNASIILRRKKN